ncbi:fatty acid desaturase family protein [Actinomycetospora chiangmaiensis]|uniref:fatty acid desaturase family protein n=1 Tax=Actinomycetospora chiangmaiensis TaxID=402650 RepID=UPI0003639B7B|nr:acyl-CoA desaturase [Actinomycetospora chiangmaiensis]
MTVRSSGSRTEPTFAELTARIKAAGLLRRRPGVYATVLGTNVLLLAGTVTAFVLLGPSWWQLVTAAVLGVVTTQLAFVGHDAGHRQIFAGRRANDVVGHLHGALVGMSFGAWVVKHNTHHASPNHADADPDIDIPVLAFSVEQAADRRGFARWAVAHQAFLFLPLLLLEGWNLHLVAFQEALRRRVPRPRLEIALLTAHVLGYLAAVLLVLTPWQAVAFVLVHQAVWGVAMGLAFAPNHKGMPVLPRGTQLDHLHKQVLTSRDVRGGRVLGYLLGGLEHQVTHHLFPRMPRPNLARGQVLVEAFCLEHGLPYTRVGALDSYRQVLRHLHEVSAPLRA